MSRAGILGFLSLLLACTASPAAVTPVPSRSEPSATGASTVSPPVAATCPAVRPISLGAVAGSLGYPSEFIPKLVVFAIRADDASTYRVLHTTGTPPGPARYSMAAVEPGAYVVIAYVDRPDSSSGGFTAAVACGLTSNCTDHSLRRVTVAPGQTVTGVDLVDWYASPGTFPLRPAGSQDLRSGDGVNLCNPYADSANVRASAGLAFPVRRTLDNGARLVVRDGPLPADGYDWYEVNVAGDQLASGWVVAYALRR